MSYGKGGMTDAQKRMAAAHRGDLQERVARALRVHYWQGRHFETQDFLTGSDDSPCFWQEVAPDVRRDYLGRAQDLIDEDSK